MKDDTTATPLFDWNAYEDNDAGELRIKNPVSGEPTPMVVTLAGPEHADRKRALHKRMRSLRAEMSKTQKMPVRDPIEEEEEQTEDLVAFTLGWNGGPVPYSKDAARALYTDPKRRWLRDQVVAGLAERELFIRASAQA